MSISVRLKELRAAKKESLQKVADAVGASKAHIWELEKGTSANPSTELLAKLANHFDVSVASLLGETADNASPEDAGFFRNYQGLKPESKKLIRKIAKELKEME